MNRHRGVPPTIGDGFRDVAQRCAGNACILHDSQRWTFGDVDRASEGLAAGLVASGVECGDRVALLCSNGPVFVGAYLAIAKAGAAVVPLNVRLHPKELAFILADAGVKALLCAEDLLGLTRHAAIEALEVPIRATLGGASVGAEIAVQGLAEPGGALCVASLGAEDLAAILYTSGTTGRPKGAMLTHGNLIANAQAVADALAYRDGEDRVLVVLPMFHAFAATVGVLAPLLRGGACIPVARFEPGLVSEAVALHRATVFLGVPTMYQLLLRAGEALRGKWTSVRCCVSGGAAMPTALLQSFEQGFGIPILEGDGPTECSPVTCVNPLDGARKLGSVGLPLPGVEMTIRDSSGDPLPVDELGEVCVRGPNVMQGYWRLPEATSEAFFGDWLRTGDLGYRDADGYFYLVDRLKDLIISDGANVYPRVIEEVLYRHPNVLEAAVVGEPHRLHGEVPVAHVVTSPAAAELTERDLRAWCRDSLGVHEVPRRFVIRDELPKNAAGKILKRELRRTGEVERGVDLQSDG